MKFKISIYPGIISLILFAQLVSCKKDKIIEPLLTITPITNITFNSATSGGKISNGGGAVLTSRGVCWSITENPTTKNQVTSDGADVGNYVSQLTGLLPGTKYYIKAYATNLLGTGYSSQLSFTTIAQVLSQITTNSISSITSTAATCGGSITSDGGAPVTSRGVCWNTTENPTIANSKTSNGSGTGTFTSTLSGLSMGTTYYVRAYATNSIGTAYGNQVTFVTLGPPTITTTSATLITSTGATSGGNITSDGGSGVTSRGVCWSISANPTINLTTKTTNGSGIGVFTSSITGLLPGATYYVRAYATNAIGTAYGAQLSFSTPGPPTVTTTVVTSVSSISALTGGSVTSDGGSTVSARGVCWSTSSNPTTTNSKTTDGTGIGSFASSVTGLTANTRYYLRAYATNSTGTGYGNELILKTYTGTITDVEGNIYNTVTIGTQVWMAENLKATKYRNGDLIGTTIPASLDISGESSPKYQWAYSGNETNVPTYGRLYTWYTITDSRNVCPLNWHVSTDNEWIVLENYLITNGYNYDGSTTGNKIAKALSSTTLWNSSTIEGSVGNLDYVAYRNKSGFTALPSGVRYPNGAYYNLGSSGEYQTATASSPAYNWYRAVNSQSIAIDRYGATGKSFAWAVRCVKD